MPSSSEFNAICYLARYPELTAGDDGAYIHGQVFTYMGFDPVDKVWREGTNLYNDDAALYVPKATPYNVSMGLNEKTNRHFDNVTKISDNPFLHWQIFGEKEGRVPGCDLPGTVYSDKFNGDAYLKRYPHLLKTTYKNNPLKHYQTIGIMRGLKPGFELLDPKTTLTGLVTPGTTSEVDNNPLQNLTPGDGTVITAPLPPGQIPVQNSDSSKIKTYFLIGGAALAALLLLKKKNPQNVSR